jgi:hypothetical protein
MASTDAGTTIERNPLLENTEFSKRDSLDSATNVTDSRDSQGGKHPQPITSIDEIGDKSRGFANL